MRRKTDQRGLIQWAFLLGFLFLAAGVMRSGTTIVGAAPVSAPAIATIRISDVINGLEELKDREAELKLFIKDQRAGIKAIGEDLQNTVDELNLLPQGSPQRKAMVQKAMRLRLNLEVEGEISGQLIDQRRGEVYSEIFGKIKDASAKLAQREGYHLVVTDDSDVEINPDTEQRVRSGILSRRVLFSDPALDLTDELILMMNNAWNAGG